MTEFGSQLHRYENMRITTRTGFDETTIFVKLETDIDSIVKHILKKTTKTVCSLWSTQSTTESTESTENISIIFIQI